MRLIGLGPCFTRSCDRTQTDRKEERMIRGNQRTYKNVCDSLNNKQTGNDVGVINDVRKCFLSFIK